MTCMLSAAHRRALRPNRALGTNVQTGESHWRTISASNVTSLYGYDASSRIADPDGAARIFSWLICRSWDDKGNVAIYQYLAEDGQGVDGSQAHEMNRTAGVRAAQRYLSSILYGNVQPYFPVWDVRAPQTDLPADWMFKVVMDYGDHPTMPPVPAPAPGWAVRPDPFSQYRAAFEVRTYRRVGRVLYFHNFPTETVGADRLVRSTDFAYSDQLTPSDPRDPIYTFLESIRQRGFAVDGTTASFPPLEFDYSQPSIQSDVRTADAESLANLPQGIDGSVFQWIDLDGEGVSGILSDWGGGWGYKSNLSPATRVTQADGSVDTAVKLAPLRAVSLLPSKSALSGQHLVDLSGGGQLDVVDFARPAPGFFKRSFDADWEPFKHFHAWPDIDWTDPNLRFVDLTGDGLADVLMTEDGLFTLYPSLGEAGYGTATLTRTPWDEDRGPTVVLADGTETVFLAGHDRRWAERPRSGAQW